MTIQQILFQREFPRISHKILCDEYWFAFEPEYMCLHFLLHSFGEGCWLSRWNDTDVHDVSVPLLHRGDASAKNTMKNTWGGRPRRGASSPPWESYAIHLRYHWSDMSGIVWSETTGIIWVRTSVSFGRYYQFTMHILLLKDCTIVFISTFCHLKRNSLIMGKRILNSIKRSLLKSICLIIHCSHVSMRNV